MIPQLNKVLVIGVNPTDTKMLIELAKHNPSVQFDFATTFEVGNIDIQNVKVIHMDLYYNIPSTLVTEENFSNLIEVANHSGWVGFFFWLKTFLNTNIENYDFVISTHIHLQTAKWFQDYRNKRPLLCISSTANKLEEDKLFAKQILLDLNIPTPKFKILDKETILSNLDELSKDGFPVVIKCNIMAGPLSTWVFPESIDSESIETLLRKIKYIVKTDNTPTPEIYTEEYINGKEVSVHFLCNGSSWEFVGTARDYKRNFDGDTGPNTSGTGCYSPVNYFTDDIKEKIFSYMNRLMRYLNNMGIYYNGFMYIGVIIDENNNPYILEVNARPGCPELLTILETIDTSNLLENLYRAATGADLLEIKQNNQTAVAVGLIHKVFPGPRELRFDSSKPIIVDIPTDIQVYNHFTILINQNTYGFVTASDTTKEQASTKIYKFLNSIETNDFRYRTDIGFLE